MSTIDDMVISITKDVCTYFDVDENVFLLDELVEEFIKTSLKHNL